MIFLIIILLTFLTAACDNTNQSIISKAEAEKALNLALEQSGKPYVWGGDGSDNFDCSGLIIYSYRKTIGRDYIFKVGREITKDATMEDLYNWNVNLIPPQKMVPGDIVFITKSEGDVTHGGLFIEWMDDGYNRFKFVNASSYHKKVTIDTWSIEGTKRKQWFVGAGRFKVAY